MTFTSYPFDVGAGAAITATQWRAMARRWRGSGVNKGDRNGLAVAAGAGLQTTVASGSGFVVGHYADNDASVTLSHTAADATFGRLDLVCLELDLSDLNAPLIEPVVVTGTPSGSPVLPALTQTSTIYQIPLASVAVAALATSVGAIVDYRPWAGYQPRLVDGVGGGTATTSSTTYVDMTTMDTGSIYTDGGDIEVFFGGSIWSNTGGGSIQIGIALDGGAEAYLGTINSSDANYAQQFSDRHLFTSVAAGFHRIKIRWLSGSGAHIANANNSRRMIWAEVH
jgi:hypothetical protein